MANTAPIVFIDGSTSTALVMSPASNFMAASYSVHPAMNPPALQWGVMGGVSTIPSEYELSFMVYATSDGVRKTMMGLGDALLGAYGKSRFGGHEKDTSLRLLSFSTDNGAYYNTLGGVPCKCNSIEGHTCQDTMVDVAEYADKVTIPYRFMLFDCWFYLQSADGAMKNWTAYVTRLVLGVIDAI